MALYGTISRINHSCRPNALWSFESGNEETKEVRAIKKIEKGQEILALYLGGIIDSHTPCLTRARRRSDLLRKFQFACSCELCSGADQEEEDLRARIKRLDEVVLECAPQMKLEQAITAAFGKVGLMERCEGLVHELPFANIELYELYRSKGKSDKS